MQNQMKEAENVFRNMLSARSEAKLKLANMWKIISEILTMYTVLLELADS